MKRLLLLAVLMVAAATVTAQDLKLADRVIRVDDVYEGYKLVSARCGRIDMGFGDTPPVAFFNPGYGYAERWTMYPTAVGTFRTVKVELVGQFCATCIDQLFRLGYTITSDRRENYWVMGQPAPWRVIRLKKGNVVVKFIDPQSEPTGVTSGNDSAAVYGGDFPVGDFIVEFHRTN